MYQISEIAPKIVQLLCILYTFYALIDILEKCLEEGA